MEYKKKALRTIHLVKYKKNQELELKRQELNKVRVALCVQNKVMSEYKKKYMHLSPVQTTRVKFRPPQCEDLSFKLFLKPLSSDICNQNGGPVDGADQDLPQG